MKRYGRTLPRSIDLGSFVDKDNSEATCIIVYKGLGSSCVNLDDFVAILQLSSRASDAMTQQQHDAMTQQHDAMTQQQYHDAMTQQYHDAMTQQQHDAMTQKQQDAMTQQQHNAMTQLQHDAMTQKQQDAMTVSCVLSFSSRLSECHECLHQH